MTILKTPALVLRARRFSESSLVVTLLSRDHGRIDALAKGARREKSPLHGHLDLYQLEDVLVYRRPAGGLDLLTEAAFADEHAGLRFYPPAFAAAGLLADVAAEATLPGEPQPELFAVLAGAFHVLAGLGEAAAKAGLAEPLPFTPGDKNTIIQRTLKLALLDMFGWLGFGLELRQCVVCGRSTGDAAVPARISRGQGGLICPACRSKAVDAIAIPPAALATLRERGPGAERAEIALSPGERRRWLRFLLEYAQYVLEKPLRGKKVLYQLLDA